MRKGTRGIPPLLASPRVVRISHASLLPKYRGAAPINWAIINGEEETGVTTMFMNEKMDEGDILLARSVDVDEFDNAIEVEERLEHLFFHSLNISFTFFMTF